MTVVQGWDLALNHSACVELTDGKMTAFCYVTDRAGDAKKSRNGIYFKKPDKKKHPDSHLNAMKRLVFMEDIFAYWLAHLPDYVGIEHYAMGQATNAYHIGELGGVARLLCWQAGVPFRLIDPSSVKMYVTHDGSCQKDEVEYAVKKRWGQDFSKYNATDKRQTSEDLADAYGIARMIWDECRFRAGELQLNELHKKEIQVYNRVTKAMSVCLIDRDWTQEDAEA